MLHTQLAHRDCKLAHSGIVLRLAPTPHPPSFNLRVLAPGLRGARAPASTNLDTCGNSLGVCRVSVPLRGVRERVSKSIPLRMPPPRNPGIPHSDHPGVKWHERTSKWVGKVQDRSVRAGKNAKQIHVGYFADEQACAAAMATKQAEVDAAIAQKLHAMAQELHAMAQELPHTRGLQGGGKTRERKRRKNDGQTLEGVGGAWILLGYTILFACVIGFSALLAFGAPYKIVK